MWPNRVLNPGPLALESDVLPTALRSPAENILKNLKIMTPNKTAAQTPVSIRAATTGYRSMSLSVLQTINPFQTRYPFWGIMQTAQTQFRRHTSWLLNRVNTVWLQEFLCKI